MKVLKVLLFLSVSTFFFYWGRYVSLSSVFDLNEGLINLSAIVFGVMGAWLAIIYPDVLNQVGKADEIGAGKKASGRVREVVEVTLVAVLSLSFSILIYLLSPLLAIWLGGEEAVGLASGILLAVIACIYMVLVLTLLRTVRAAFGVLMPLAKAGAIADAKAAVLGVESRKKK